MTSWEQIATTGPRLGIDELKERLPLPYVVEKSGVALSGDKDRLVGLCPFHDDETPSFAIFGENLATAGCWSCDFRTGDLFDYIQRWKDTSLSDAISEANKLLAEYDQDDSWVPVKTEKAVVADPKDLLAAVREAYRLAEVDNTAINRLLEAKGLPIDPQWLHTEWWIGVVNDVTTLIPHFTKDRTPTGYKTRTPTTHPYALSGSRFPAMYGEWRVSGHNKVILCEGESDTWWVSWIMRDLPVDVLGLPTGIASVPKADWVTLLKDKDVVLLFDGDAPGRGGARTWAKAIFEHVSRCQVVPLAEGADAASLSARALKKAIVGAIPVESWVPDVTRTSQGYTRTTTGQLITDWTFDPERYLAIEGGFGFEGRMAGIGTGVTVSSLDFINTSALTRWSNRWGKHFFGTARDLQQMLKFLSLERPFLPQGRGTFKTGWHEGSFVLPSGEVIGPGDWTYLPGEVTAQMSRIVTLDRDEGDPATVIPTLLKLHADHVVRPLVGWTASAIMRAAFHEFPVLAVVGGSGVGKTTIIDAVLSAFGFGGGEHNMTSTTRYGLSMLASGSTGVPVWIDEYRHGARRDAKEAMDQLVRDAWTSGASLRGGVGANLSEVHEKQASAPLIVSGEDVFAETSLRERIVMVRVPMDITQRDPEALQTLRSLGQIGRKFISWLVAHPDVQAVPVIQGDRRAVSRGVVRHGWDLFAQWSATYGIDVGPFSLDEASRKDEIDPVLEMVVWGLDVTDSSWKPVVWVDEKGRLCVRVRELMKAGESVNFPLPGGERAISDWLLEHFKGGSRVRTTNGRTLVLSDGSGARLMQLIEESEQE